MAWASLRQFVLGWFAQPVSALALNDRTRPAMPIRQAHPGDIVALTSATTAGAAGEVAVSLVATGNSTGDVFRLETRNLSGALVAIGAPDGLVLQPLKQAAAAAIRTPQAALSGQSVMGYCLEFAKLPPPAGMLYRVADQAVQQQFAPMTRVIQAGRKLAAEGRLNPDGDDAVGYVDAIKQWAVWSRLEKWDAAAFEQHFVERTRKNFANARRPWSSDLERRVRQLAQNRWQDIQKVWAEADQAAPGAKGAVSVH
jgi:hypothetical protein